MLRVYGILLATLTLPRLVELRYEPTWSSLDARPLPHWFDQAKIGIFIHWGVYSVPAFQTEWFLYDWKERRNDTLVKFMSQNYAPNFQYADFASQFRAELWNPDRWASIFEKSGAKYVVLTSKHHDGFALWPSAFSSNWNSMDVGPKRDLVGELARSVRSRGLKFGLYHSLFEWFHPLYLEDKRNNFTTNTFVKQKIYPEMIELVKNYRPDVIWSDGDWEAGSEYWNSKEFQAWLFNDAPNRDEVVVNDRWGTDANCQHGSFLNCQDRFDPKKPPKKKWENAMTLDKKNWGFRREATLDDYYTGEELVSLLVRTVARGGNLIINVGPNCDGTLSPIFEDRLMTLGKWLAQNGEAIYSTAPGEYISENYWLTRTNNASFVSIVKIPDNWAPIELPVRLFPNVGNIRVLGYERYKVQFEQTETYLRIEVPNFIIKELLPVLKLTM